MARPVSPAVRRGTSLKAPQVDVEPEPLRHSRSYTEPGFLPSYTTSHL